jgi:hypothetical protein
MSTPTISLPWKKVSRMCHALGELYDGIPVDLFRAGIMKMLLEHVTSTPTAIADLQGREYGLHRSDDVLILSLPFSEDERLRLKRAGYDLDSMSSSDVERLFYEAFREAGCIEIDTGLDAVVPNHLAIGRLKASLSLEWGAYLITYVQDEETGAWMACPASPVI